MTIRAVFAVLVYAVGLVLSVGGPYAFGQPKGQEPSTTSPENDLATRTTTVTLKSILESLETTENQLKVKEKELKTAPLDDQKVRIVEEIKKLNAHQDALRKDFAQIASGVDVEAFSAKPQERFDWKQEMQDLLEPIIRELKDMTARPRELEKLRNQVHFLEEGVQIAGEAVKNVQGLIVPTNDQKLKSELTALEKSLKDKEQQLSNQLAIAQYQLAEKLNEKQSVWGSMRDLLLVFFRSRGRNFILAFLTFVFVFLLLRFIQQYLYKAYPFLQSAKRSFYFRLADVTYQILTFAGAVMASLFILYVAGDWVLLGLALIFLFGLAWTAKQTLPLFWDHAKLMLNLGSVREGERLVYGGLPWKVVSLNVYTRLVNPELTGGTISLRLGQLVSLNSRPYEPHEPWFPCKEGDWVILGDGTRGKVVVQTPETVQLILLGGSRKTYPTEEFLKQVPNNISTNFRLKVAFGIDYKHQAEVTRDIPATLHGILTEELTKEGYGDDLVSLKVEFKEAAASSLDIEILADFSGNAAKDYERLSRIIQRISVEACNEHGWEIPFPQVTLHTRDPQSGEKA